MSDSVSQYLGQGMYTVKEAALYARVSTRKISRWIFGAGTHKPIIEPQFTNGKVYVTFLDLVQALAIRDIRANHDVPLWKFRRAIKLAKKDLGMAYPFARPHQTLFDGDNLIIEKAPGEYVDVSSRGASQRLLTPIMEPYMTRLRFDDNGLASLYTIFEADGVAITLDPKVRFGEPLLPSGYTAIMIAERIPVEGSEEAAADEYGIDVREVRVAHKFYTDYLQQELAA